MESMKAMTPPSPYNGDTSPSGAWGGSALSANSRSTADNELPSAGHRTATMKPFTALLGAAAGTHAADQLALATLPLTATLVLGAGPDVLGLLVAAQSAAWLLVTLPAGAWVDRSRGAPC